MSNSYTIDATTIVHTNTNYYVVISDTADGYGVVNRATGVTEFEAISLPECMFAAENLNVVIEFSTWEWVGKRAADQKAEDIAESAKAAAAVSYLN